MTRAQSLQHIHVESKQYLEDDDCYFFLLGRVDPDGCQRWGASTNLDNDQIAIAVSAWLQDNMTQQPPTIITDLHGHA